MVEAALSLFAFLSILLMGIELLQISFAAVSMQYALNRTVRYAAIVSSSTDTSRETAIREKLIDISPVAVAPEQITMCPLYLPSCTSANAGGPGEWVSIKVSRLLPVAFGLGSIQINAASIWKNEYWIQS
ncbi:MAG: hypothetical protein DCC75_02270 [Proteobacteria bacterium]|nr:MAG: hypothetical protein DCC75_02270 [Pseudomonadota bacterium]